MTTLNLDRIVDVSVQISPVAAPRGTFNQLLIIGSTDVIPTSERVREYTSVDDMLTDGFIITDPEYIAASIYFSQTPSPEKVWIGRQSLEGSPLTPETCVEAVTACRLANYDWYICMCLDAVTADHKAIATYIETCVPTSIYAFTTGEADVLEASPSPVDVFTYLKALD